MQSSFLPWLGYFDLIKSVDHFIFLEEVQYTKRDWRNRNLILGSNGPEWITAPVESKGKRSQTIREAKLLQDGWSKRMLKTINHHYSKAPFFDDLDVILHDIISGAEGQSLSLVNRSLISKTCSYLGINTKLSDDEGVNTLADPSQRIASLVKSVGGNEYLSGPRAKSYLELAKFEDFGISVKFVSYPQEYGPYQQQTNIFAPNLSVVDSIANLGLESRRTLSRLSHD